MPQQSLPQPPSLVRGCVYFAFAVFALAALSPAGCAKSPTVVRAQISADATVPPLYILRSTVVRSAAPTDVAIVSVVSQIFGDATDRPVPYQLPLFLDIEVPPSWSGDARLTIDGLSWDVKDAVVATGFTMARLSSEKTTDAALMLTGVSGGGAGADAGTLPVDAGADTD